MRSLLNVKIVPFTKIMFVPLCVMYKNRCVHLLVKCSITNVGYTQATLLQNIYTHREYFQTQL